MNTNRDCGCKSFRTCLECENKYGLSRDTSAEERLLGAEALYRYDAEAEADGGRGRLVLESGEDAGGLLNRFRGIKLIRDFVTESEESRLLSNLDSLPWDTSVSGRRKQNFGPRANFNGRRLRAGAFHGFPACSEFVQRRFSSVPCLEGYRAVEQCSIEYRPESGASIEPHIDDCWVWGERIVQLNLLSDSVLTCLPYHCTDEEGAGVNGKKNKSKYNLAEVESFPRVLDEGGEKVLWNPFREGEEFHNSRSRPYLRGEDRVEGTLSAAVRIPLPRRSLLVMHGQARYEWEHCILRGDIQGRRVVIAYRELTPPFLPGGEHHEAFGEDILDKAAKFW